MWQLRGLDQMLFLIRRGIDFNFLIGPSDVVMGGLWKTCANGKRN
jgi:hypothetical protein